MKKKRAAEGTGGKVVAGVTVLVLGIAGLGWVRRRAAGEPGGQCRVVEESVYRGFKYRIEECPAGEGRVYLGLVPSQQVGTITITTDESESLDTIDDARKYVQSSIDARLGPQLKAVFVGRIDERGARLPSRTAPLPRSPAQLDDRRRSHCAGCDHRRRA